MSYNNIFNINGAMQPSNPMAQTELLPRKPLQQGGHAEPRSPHTAPAAPLPRPWHRPPPPASFWAPDQQAVKAPDVLERKTAYLIKDYMKAEEPPAEEGGASHLLRLYS
ncbi:hypothetical protein MTO96_022194 [Rhipicephalus appendiculatus]